MVTAKTNLRKKQKVNKKLFFTFAYLILVKAFKILKQHLLPSFNLVSSGKECNNCRAYKDSRFKQYIQLGFVISTQLLSLCFSLLCLFSQSAVTFLLKYFSNFRRAIMMQCSHCMGRLLRSLITWNEPSRLSPACILCTQTAELKTC